MMPELKNCFGKHDITFYYHLTEFESKNPVDLDKEKDYNVWILFEVGVWTQDGENKIVGQATNFENIKYTIAKLNRVIEEWQTSAPDAVFRSHGIGPAENQFSITLRNINDDFEIDALHFEICLNMAYVKDVSYRMSYDFLISMDDLIRFKNEFYQQAKDILKRDFQVPIIKNESE